LSLDLTEVLTCLAITSSASPATQLALDQLKELKGCEMHLTHIPTPGDETGLRRLNLNLTSDPFLLLRTCLSIEIEVVLRISRYEQGNKNYIKSCLKT